MKFLNLYIQVWNIVGKPFEKYIKKKKSSYYHITLYDNCTKFIWLKNWRYEHIVNWFFLVYKTEIIILFNIIISSLRFLKWNFERVFYTLPEKLMWQKNFLWNTSFENDKVISSLQKRPKFQAWTRWEKFLTLED